jgi:rare lipoprotein A
MLLISVLLPACGHRNTASPPSANIPGNYPTNPAPGAPPNSSSVPPRRQPPQVSVPAGYVEQGNASWYGVPFNGHRTSDGEVYNMYDFTAAHRTLPFNAVLRVTNVANGMQTQVRINDRGPFVAGRIIDLSYSAAKAIGLIGPGVAKVRLEMLSGSDPNVGSFSVQVGAFRVKENADRLQARLSATYSSVMIQVYDSPLGVFYRVRVGRLTSIAAAQQLASQLAGQGFVPFVVRLDDTGSSPK